MARSTVLVTGSSGRLGAAVVQALQDAHDVVQLDCRAPDDPATGRSIVGSITDPAAVAEAMDGVHAVIHCAAIPGPRKPYRELIETNVMGTFNLLEAAGESPAVEQFVFISSLTWHGLSEHPFTNKPLYLPADEAHASLAVDYYSCSKVSGEYWCETYARRFRKSVVAVRPPYIVPLSGEATFAAGPPPAYPHLNDYVGTGDLVDGILKCLAYHPPDGFDRFLFHAEDQRSTMPSMDLARRFFPEAPIDRAKLEACEGFGALVDATRARERLGWVPRFRCTR